MTINTVEPVTLDVDIKVSLGFPQLIPPHGPHRSLLGHTSTHLHLCPSAGTPSLPVSPGNSYTFQISPATFLPAKCPMLCFCLYLGLIIYAITLELLLKHLSRLKPGNSSLQVGTVPYVSLDLCTMCPAPCLVQNGLVPCK